MKEIKDIDSVLLQIILWLILKKYLWVNFKITILINNKMMTKLMMKTTKQIKKTIVII
jgi:hypothetical protein